MKLMDTWPQLSGSDRATVQYGDAMTSLQDVPLSTIDGKEASLGDYAGQVLLVVNVASKCGLTPQYEALEKLYEDRHDAGFEVLGFPANNFGAQEPGTNEEIAEFCSLTYDVKFPMFDKVEVNGGGAHPLWKWLKKEKPGLLGMEGIKWNFTKFLVDRNGRVVKRYAPTDTPEKIEADLGSVL